jgi:hypothetical protein
LYRYAEAQLEEANENESYTLENLAERIKEDEVGAPAHVDSP